MIRACIILLVLFKFVYGYTGDPVMFYPPSHVRSVNRYPITPEYHGNRHPHRQQKILHTSQQPVQPSQSLRSPENPIKEHDTFNDFIDALREVQESYQKAQERSQYRTAGHVERDYSEPTYRPYPGSYSRPNPPAYGPAPSYQKPTYQPAPIYQNSTPIAVPTLPDLPKLPLLKPDDLSTLLKPVSTKVSSKVSGLLGLILALFSGSSADGLEMNGLKDLVINGIIKPLLVAKGGIKSLIAKLTIPLISLLLINLEVLITVWWLWDDCDVKIPYKPYIPTYSPPKPAYNYNNYNSYR